MWADNGNWPVTSFRPLINGQLLLYDSTTHRQEASPFSTRSGDYQLLNSNRKVCR